MLSPEQTLDLEWATENHLYRTLLKNKAISQARALPEQVKLPTRSIPAGPVANVTARLYNSAPVKEVMAETVVAIRISLGLGAQPPTKKEKKTRETRREDNYTKASKPAGESDGSDGSESEKHTDGDDKSAKKVPAVSDDEDSLAEFDGRIASGSEESEEEHEDGAKGSVRSRKPVEYAVDEDLSPASDDSAVGADSGSEADDQTKTSAGRPTKASFLPSLTMGGYWSGSEGEEASDVSDVDDAPRKNRRGQRARQKIWEQKYKQNAKHLQKEAQGRGDERDRGWDLKRGAQEEGHRPPWMKAKAADTRGYKGTVSGGNATELKPRGGMKMEQKKMEKPLQPMHPSWIAAQKAKEKATDSGTFAGKKVVFD